MAKPLPDWLAKAHEIYCICQAVPQYQPTEDELSDFNLTVMSYIHSVYEADRLKKLAKVMGAKDGQ